jgi:hypothetical protein
MTLASTWRLTITTRLCALDGLQRTIYVSGTKIWRGWRVGFMSRRPAGWSSACSTWAAPPDDFPRCWKKKPWPGASTSCASRQCIRSRLDGGRSVKLALAHGCSFAAEPAGLFG